MNDDIREEMLRCSSIDDRKARRMLQVNMNKYTNILSPIELYLQWYFVNMGLFDVVNDKEPPRKKRKVSNRHLELLETNLAKINEILATCSAKLEETESRLHAMQRSSPYDSNSESSSEESEKEDLDQEDSFSASSSSSESTFSSLSRNSDEEAEEEVSEK